MPESIEISEEVRKEGEKTIEALKSIGDGEGKTVDELRDKYPSFCKGF